MKIIDQIKTTCKELFTIKIIHPGFEISYAYKNPVTDSQETLISSSVLSVLSFEPDADTKRLFGGCSIDYHCGNNILTCFTSITLQQPSVKLPDDAVLRFMIRAQTEFISNTAVVAAGSNQVYQFTNAGRTGNAGNRYITKNVTGVNDDDLKNVDVVNPESKCFGVIDIVTNVTDPVYRLFNAGNLESPWYTISFNKK